VVTINTDNFASNYPSQFKTEICGFVLSTYIVFHSCIKTRDDLLFSQQQKLNLRI